MVAVVAFSGFIRCIDVGLKIKRVHAQGQGDGPSGYRLIADRMTQRPGRVLVRDVRDVRDVIVLVRVSRTLFKLVTVGCCYATSSSSHEGETST